MSEWDDGIWARKWQQKMYCQLPECLEIHNCAHRVNGYHCASMRNLMAQAPPNVSAVIPNMTIQLSDPATVRPEPDHTVAWFYE